jgi:hypothetical protein
MGMRRDIWYFLFALGAALFSWPFMGIFRDRLIPYLFIAWLLFIGLVCVTAILSGRGEGDR